MNQDHHESADRSWNFADVWETVAETVPDAVAQVHGQVRSTYAAFDAHANGVANALLAAGLGRHDKVALYLFNTPEYLESAFGAMKVGMVPVNTNYRYRHDELLYLWDNADAAAVIFDAAFTGQVDALRARCPKVRLWLQVQAQARAPLQAPAQGRPAATPPWATPYAVAVLDTARPAPPGWARSGDDPILIYTGGTTGRPKGVIWRQHDLYRASNTTDDPTSFDRDHVRHRLQAATAAPVGLPAAPLMHGTGFVFAATQLNRGGTVVTLPEQGFDAVRLLTAVVHERVTELSIVGDAFGRPLLDALDAEPGRFDLTRLRVVTSSGMMWSREVKAGLLRHQPDLLLIDFLNSSEASGMGRSITSRRSAAGGARFRLGKNAFVIDEHGQPIAPGSNTIGRVAVRGIVPMGYYKDPERSAATFPVVDGERCAVPGDYATVEADGTITLLGRGSISINTGGEKVFPEEVEETVKTFPGVRDAVVVGAPHPRLGQIVTALVVGDAIDPDQLRGHVRERLAGYKVPREVMIVDSVGRADTGKADYNAARARMLAWLATKEQR